MTTLSISSQTASLLDNKPQTTERDSICADQVDVLVEEAKEGHRGAFTELVELFHKRVYHFLFKMVGNAQDAEDLTQDTFVKVFRKLHQHKSGHGFAPWLFTVARRTALNHFRDRKPTSELDGDYASEAQNPAVICEERDISDRFWTMTKSLKPLAREALWLRYGEGFSAAETAEVLNLNPIYVRVMLHRARKQLASQLEPMRDQFSDC